MAEIIIPDSSCPCKRSQPTAPLVPPAIPAEGPHIITENEYTHLMYLDGFLIGIAHSYEDAEVTLDEAMGEIALQSRATTADMAAEAAALRLERETA